MITIVKHGKRKPEEYNAQKLRQSIMSACLSVRLPEGVASDTATKVLSDIDTWLQHKPEVTSDDLRRIAADTLDRISPEASYIYKNYQKLL